MAGAGLKGESQHLHGIVDMGSNGIRFSISRLQPPTARIMPTLYQSRAGISLYDAQYSGSGERQPIGESTIKAVISAFRQFESTCEDFGVPESNITVIATEATRTAINSEAFRKQIKDAVGWDVKMLPKEEEGRVGAMGIASSLPEVSGLVMDLGGGSVQLSWLEPDGESTSISLPYGAAAISRRLTQAESNGTTGQLKTEIQKAIKDGYESLGISDKIGPNSKGGNHITLYLSGGGFRGWGYLLMSRHQVQPYPIPVINGFKVSRQDFVGTEDIKLAAAAILQNEDDEVFRVSDRRASQVPAVAFLINALAEVLPQVEEVRFCQGGVREGYLLSSLSSEVRKEHPLVVATRLFSAGSTQAIVTLLQAAIPVDGLNEKVDDGMNVLTRPILEAFANVMYYHSSHSKDLQASAALRSTTSGILAGVHGVLHEHRTLLALLLCARWAAEVPPTDQPFKQNLKLLVESPWTLWWINYVGAVAALVAAIFPAGIKRNSQKERLKLESRWERSDKGQTTLRLHVQLAADANKEMFAKEMKEIEKVGKKKNWIDGKDGVGHEVEVTS